MKRTISLKLAKLAALLVPHLCTMLATFHYLFQWAFFSPNRLKACMILLLVVGVLFVCTVGACYKIRQVLGYKKHDVRALSWREFLVWQPIGAHDITFSMVLYIALYSATGGLLVGAFMALLACVPA